MNENEQKYFDEVTEILSSKWNIGFVDRPKLTKLRASLELSVERALELETEAKLSRQVVAKNEQMESERQLAKIAVGKPEAATENANDENSRDAAGDDGVVAKDKPNALHWILLIAAFIADINVFQTGHWLVGLILAVFPIVLIAPFSNGDKKSHNSLGWILSVGTFFFACGLAEEGHWFWSPIAALGAVVLLVAFCVDLNEVEE